LNVLAGFKKLELLDLEGTQVTREGVAKLQKLLPKCKIHHPCEPDADSSGRTSGIASCGPS